MSSDPVPPIGERVRVERVRLGWTVRGLAREVGVSASLISQIETGKSQPSVSTLFAITTALDISIEALFSADGHEQAGANGVDTGGSAQLAEVTSRGGLAPDPGRNPAVTTAAELAGAGTGERRTFGRDRSRCVGPVVPPENRDTLTLESGVTWELMGQVPGVPVEFLRVTYPPASSSSSGGQLMRHPGAEFGYLLSGQLKLTLGFDELVINALDAFSFASTTPHGYRNDGDEPAVGVWFVLEEHLGA